MFSDKIGNSVNFLGGMTGFVARYEAQVTFNNAETVIVLQRADDRYLRVMLDHGAQFGFMPGSAQLVENNPGDPDLGIEGLIAQDQGGDAARHSARINDEHNRGFQQARQGGVAVTAVEVQAVIQSLVALDQADVGVAGMDGEGIQDLIPSHQIEVQVMAIALAGEA